MSKVIERDEHSELRHLLLREVEDYLVWCGFNDERVTEYIRDALGTTSWNVRRWRSGEITPTHHRFLKGLVGILRDAKKNDSFAGYKLQTGEWTIRKDDRGMVILKRNAARRFQLREVGAKAESESVEKVRKTGHTKGRKTAPRSSDPKVITSMTFDKRVHDIIRDKAKERNESMSLFTQRLIEEGLFGKPVNRRSISYKVPLVITPDGSTPNANHLPEHAKERPVTGREVIQYLAKAVGYGAAGLTIGWLVGKAIASSEIFRSLLG